MNYITRKIEQTISEAAEYFPVIAVTGPRQSGKSTLLSHLFPDAVKFSLKDVNIRNFAESDPIAFLNQTDKPLFIDEVQKVPVLLEYIQGIVDNYPYRKFFLSGSSNFELMKSVSESLAGRAGVYELLPMSYPEVSTISDKKELDTFLYDGLFPAIYAGKNIARLFYPSYVRTYIEKDIRDLLHIRDTMQFLRFLKF